MVAYSMFVKKQAAVALAFEVGAYQHRLAVYHV